MKYMEDGLFLTHAERICVEPS